jgi:hypothetical protein
MSCSEAFETVGRSQCRLELEPDNGSQPDAAAVDDRAGTVPGSRGDARDRHRHGADLDTFTFQAPKFYERRGH